MRRSARRLRSRSSWMLDDAARRSASVSDRKRMMSSTRLMNSGLKNVERIARQVATS